VDTVEETCHHDGSISPEIFYFTAEREIALTMIDQRGCAKLAYNLIRLPKLLAAPA
jgi:hypothetical protein